jgi:hypothetical protein
MKTTHRSIARNLLLVSIFFLSIFSVNAQSTQSIIDQYVKFVGGEKKWKKIKTITTTGEYDYGGISFPFKTFASAPDHYKFIVESNGKYYAQGFDGSKGWKIDAFKNETTPTMLTGPDAKAMANEADVELVDAIVRLKGHIVDAGYAGRDSVKSHYCYRIKTSEAGTNITYYFDTKTYELVMKKTISKNAELNKAPMNIYYSDYRDIGGVKIPFKTICESDKQVILTITVQNAKLDQPIEENEFQP